MYLTATYPFSETHQKFYTVSIAKKSVPSSEISKHGSKLSFSDLINMLKEAYPVYDHKKRKLKVQEVEILKLEGVEEYAVHIGKYSYILDHPEVKELKKLLTSKT